MKMDRQQAKHIIKNTGYIGNEIGVAFDVAIKSMDKLDKIEQIVNSEVDPNICNNVGDVRKVQLIKEVLENG